MGHLGHGAFGLNMGSQSVGQLSLTALHVGLSYTGLKVPGRYREKIRVVVGIGIVEPPVHGIHSSRQIAGGSLNGFPAARFAQQSKEDPDGFDHQRFA